MQTIADALRPSVADLVARWDQRLLADLATDSGQPEQNLPQNPRLLAALSGASGELRGAILKGRRYQLDEELTDEDAAYLKDLVCSLAMLRLAACRVSTLGSDVWDALRKDLQERLDALAKGERIFATQTAQQADLPKTQAPLLANVYRMNLMVDRCCRFYPARAEEWPTGGG